MEGKAPDRVYCWGLWQPCFPGSGGQCHFGNVKAIPPEESYGLLRVERQAGGRF